MKILKRAEQKNVTLDKSFYTEYEIERMLNQKEVTMFDKDFNFKYEGYDKMFRSEQEQTDVVIFTDDLTDIKVKLIDGHYHTVAIGKNGKEYNVIL